MLRLATALKRLQWRFGPTDDDQTRALKAQLSGKVLVFCLTNGRTGSAQLCKLLCALKDADVHHEPAPYFHSWRKWTKNDDGLAYQFLLRTKLPHIARLPGRIYVETSHVFGKGFFYPMLRSGIPFRCIVLSRNPREVALSCVALTPRPGASENSSFYLTPDEAECLPITKHARLTDYQIFYWHALEMEARARKYSNILALNGTSMVEIRTEHLGDKDRILALIADLGSSTCNIDMAKLEPVLHMKSNEKRGKKKVLNYNETDLELQEAEVKRLITSGTSASCPAPRVELVNQSAF